MAVYFVQALEGGPIKVGTTTRLSVRLKQLAKESDKKLWVLGVVDGGRAVEKALHERFAHLRIAGEWFSPGPDLHEFIAKEAKDWDGVDEVAAAGNLVRVDADILRRVEMIAVWRDISVSQCIADLLRRPISTESNKIIRGIERKYGKLEEPTP